MGISNKVYFLVDYSIHNLDIESLQHAVPRNVIDIRPLPCLSLCQLFSNQLGNCEYHEAEFIMWWDQFSLCCQQPNSNPTKRVKVTQEKKFIMPFVCHFVSIQLFLSYYSHS